MPLKCFFKPQRTKRRVFTAEKIGKIACELMREGSSTLAEIEAEIAKCVRRDRSRSSDALEALEAAAVALEQNNVVIDADARSLNAFLTLPLVGRLVLALIARIPVAGPILAVGLPAIRELATVRIASITAQKAANDATLLIVRRAAANEARFIRTGTGG